MEIHVHLPRKTEAELVPALNKDLIVKPKFYKKTGTVPIFYITTVDALGNEERHVLTIGAGTKFLKVEKLIEVLPKCDEQSTTVNVPPIEE